VEHRPSALRTGAAKESGASVAAWKNLFRSSSDYKRTNQANNFDPHVFERDNVFYRQE
jgi:hypothetical protein